MDGFEGHVSAWFNNIEMLDLEDIRDDMGVLRVEAHSLSKIHMLAISLGVPPFFQPSPSLGPRHFDLFMENDRLFSYLGPSVAERGTCRILVFYFSRT